MIETKEIRGAEAAEFIQQLTEEQRQIMTTIHANSPEGVIQRLVKINNEKK